MREQGDRLGVVERERQIAGRAEPAERANSLGGATVIIERLGGIGVWALMFAADEIEEKIRFAKAAITERSPRLRKIQEQAIESVWRNPRVGELLKTIRDLQQEQAHLRARMEKFLNVPVAAPPGPFRRFFK